MVSYNQIKVAITYKRSRHLCLLLDEFLAILVQLLLSLVTEQFSLSGKNSMADQDQRRGLSKLSLGKCWSLAYNYKGDN